MNPEDIKEGDVITLSEYKEFCKNIPFYNGRDYVMIQNPFDNKRGFDIIFYEVYGEAKNINGMPTHGVIKEGCQKINFKVQLNSEETLPIDRV